jgi:hypothetical protein
LVNFTDSVGQPTECNARKFSTNHISLAAQMFSRLSFCKQFIKKVQPFAKRAFHSKKLLVASTAVIFSSAALLYHTKQPQLISCEEKKKNAPKKEEWKAPKPIESSSDNSPPIYR